MPDNNFLFLKFNGIYLNFEKQHVTNILNIHELKYWIILFLIICFFRLWNSLFGLTKKVVNLEDVFI